jgi:hypothetical protein
MQMESERISAKEAEGDLSEGQRNQLTRCVVCLPACLPACFRAPLRRVVVWWCGGVVLCVAAATARLCSAVDRTALHCIGISDLNQERDAGGKSA